MYNTLDFIEMRLGGILYAIKDIFLSIAVAIVNSTLIICCFKFYRKSKNKKFFQL